MPAMPPAATLLAVVMATTLPAMAAATCRRQLWVPMDWPCQAEASSACGRLDSLEACLMRVGRLAGFNAAQWRDGVCCALDHGRLCRPQAANATDCRVFVRRAPLLRFVRSLGARLAGVWVADTAGGVSRLQELTCSGGAPQARNVTFTEEGAVFNGVNSYMRLNGSEVTNTAGGLTWLMRLRRTPRLQPFMEIDTQLGAGPHFWEFDATTRLFFNNLRGFAPFRSVKTQTGALPSATNAWLNVGVTANPSSNQLNLFVNGDFYPTGSLVTVEQPSEPATFTALLIGSRRNTNDCLQGTVAAVAVAKAPMNQSEIRQFFALLP